MNRKLIVAAVAAVAAGVVMARPGPGGFHGGPRGGFGPRSAPMRAPGGFHHHHHHHHGGWGPGLAAAGLAVGAAAVVRDIVAPRPVVYTTPAPVYTTPTPVYTTPPAVYTAPPVAYAPPPPPPPPPPPVGVW